MCSLIYILGGLALMTKDKGVIRVVVDVVVVMGRPATGDNNLREFCVFDSYAEMV